ncbi:MAG: hypothetical protein GX796_06290 [Clostridiaceae bacterium]|nr:hypothetical protein [Clostridiaceae bacterium]
MTNAYPSYRKFFCEIDRKTALYFWKTYPSPVHLKGKTAEELAVELKAISPNYAKGKAEMILECVEKDGNTHRDFQASRDFITQSLVRDLEH